MRRSTLYLLAVLIVLGYFKYSWDQELRRTKVLVAQTWPARQAANTLAMPQPLPSHQTLDILTHPPLELDELSREDIFTLRKESVARHAHLVSGEYAPSPAVFGKIIDGKPWWGLRGQLCHGPGKSSIAGLSEESRFLVNPFHLLYLDEAKMFNRPPGCYPVYARPASLVWSLDQTQAVARYDLSRFRREKRALGLPAWNTTFTLDRLNALDFGYHYLYINPKRSKNIKPAGKTTRVLKEPCQLKGLIHLGGSCGYPGGCNNGSPYQGELYFRVKSLPATVHAVLWKQPPENKKQEPDFTFILQLE